MNILPPPIANDNNSIKEGSSSDFIEDDLMIHVHSGASMPVQLGETATSTTYRLNRGGETMFMKKIKHEYLNNSAYRNLFKKEYEVGCRLSHPNIVKYVSLCDEANSCYLLMEHIQGETLDERIRNNPGYFTQRAHVDKFVMQLLDSINYLHLNNVLHCDLKPQNVMLTQVNNDVKVVDLGFCLSNSYIHTAGMTRQCAAPEQLSGSLQQLDDKTDIYAIGKLLEYIDCNTHGGLPYIYRRIMKKCLRHNREERYDCVADIIGIMQRHKQIMKLVPVGVIFLLMGVSMWLYPSMSLSGKSTQQDDYDIVEYGVGYKILSEEERTCEAVCHKADMVHDIVIHDYVVIDNKKYRTVNIADNSFAYDTIAVSLYIPDGIERIGDRAFSNIKGVSYISIPNSVQHIGRDAFIGIDNATQLDLSNNTDTIKERTFACLYKLKTIDIPEGVKVLKLDAFAGCWGLEQVTLPSTLTAIERGVFYECTSLTEIHIPAGVNYIGEYCFYHCTALKDIYNYNPIPQMSRPLVEPTRIANITLHVPRGSAERYRNASMWNEMNIVEMEE